LNISEKIQDTHSYYRPLIESDEASVTFVCHFRYGFIVCV